MYIYMYLHPTVRRHVQGGSVGARGAPRLFDGPSTLTVHDCISHAHRRRDPENDRRCVPAHEVLQQTITDNAGKHRHGTSTCTWQAQAQMLSRALPIDVVCVVGVHVHEQAAVTLQNCVRGAAVRVPYWGQLGQACVTVTATLCTSTVERSTVGTPSIRVWLLVPGVWGP